MPGEARIVVGLNTGMRYYEIIQEDFAADAVSAANTKTNKAAGKYQAKLGLASDQAAAAARLKPGAERVRRSAAAQQKRSDARRVYQDSLNSANDAAQDARRKAARLRGK